MIRCKKCLGTNVQVAMWVQVNTNQIKDEFFSWNDHPDLMAQWCEDCGEHVELEQFEPEEKAHG